MVERLLCKQDVRSSNLLGSTKIPVQRGFFVVSCGAADACSSRIHAVVDAGAIDGPASHACSAVTPASRPASTQNMPPSSSEAAAPFRASASPRAQGCTTFPEHPFACPATRTTTADTAQRAGVSWRHVALRSARWCRAAAALRGGDADEPWPPSTRRSATRSSVSTGFLVPCRYFGVHAQTSPCRHGSVGSGNGSACRGLRRRLR